MHAIVNEHLKRPLRESVIAATEVTNGTQRLLNIAGNRCVVLEHTIYDMTRRITDDYDGGLWTFYNLSNGGFYMAPKTDQSFDLSCENTFEHEVSADTAGIIACAMAYSHLSFLENGECFAEAYQLLSDYIFQHRDAGIIRAALD
ncbi:MAG: antirestriction protein [Massilia sp.]